MIVVYYLCVHMQYPFLYKASRSSPPLRTAFSRTSIMIHIVFLMTALNDAFRQFIFMPDPVDNAVIPAAQGGFEQYVRPAAVRRKL